MVTRRELRRGSANWSTHTFNGRDSISLTPTTPPTFFKRRQLPGALLDAGDDLRDGRRVSRCSRTLSIDRHVADTVTGTHMYSYWSSCIARALEPRTPFPESGLAATSICASHGPSHEFPPV